jgi:SAM-dependent methyltransferase
MTFQNTYQDQSRAMAYNELEFDGTYRLAADCLPQLFDQHVKGNRALDFGCGTGRSTRLLQKLGFDTIGIDISRRMVDIARENDSAGDYRVIADGNFSSLDAGTFDLILCAFPFDNIPHRQHKVHLFTGLGHLLAAAGRLVNIVSTPEIYLNEWVTFTTREFPANRHARCGDVVKIITKDYSDGRPVEDIIWPDADYQSVYGESGLTQVHSTAPLAKGNEGIDWVNETTIAPWRIYVLKCGDEYPGV